MSSSPEQGKIDEFKKAEDIWRSIATVLLNHFIDKGPDEGRTGVDVLLNSDQYGGRLKQIRQSLGG